MPGLGLNDPVFSGVSLGITGHDYPPIEMYIAGGDTETLPLYTLGPDLDANVELVINPNHENQIPLKIKGKETYNNNATLHIGKEYKILKDATLYINNDSFAIGGSGVGQDIELFLNAVSGSLYDSPTLFLKSPDVFIGSGETNIPLFLKVEEPILSPEGAIINSGIFSIFMDGNNDANLSYRKNQEISLFLPVNGIESGNITLFLDRPASEIMPLNIRSFTTHKDMNVYISGNYTHKDNISLLIKAPESNNFRFFFRGYLA